MSLKELTMSQHTNAERQKFAGVLMSGKISEESYLKYLQNQFYCYYTLENHSKFNLPDDRLKRSDNILEDIQELKQTDGFDYNMRNALTESTKDYIKYVKENIKTQEDFMAHVYVRYLGDLRGGQMISKKVPGSGKYYEFDEPEELANSIYRQLNDDMAEEAKKVFDFATKLFIEMYEQK
jgi:heme oxygenase